MNISNEQAEEKKWEDKLLFPVKHFLKKKKKIERSYKIKKKEKRNNNR